MHCSSHWLETLPDSMSLDMLRDFAWSHACEAGPYESVLKDMIHKGQFRKMCEFEIDYSLEGLTVSAVRHARQALAFFSKLRPLDIGIDRDGEGLRKFLEAEQLCAETNLRFAMRRNGTLGFPSRVEQVFETARRKVRMVLRDPPPLDELTLRFGPGSTRKTRKADASTRRKCAEGITCSEELFPLVKALLRELPHLSSENAQMSWVDEDGDEWDRVDVDVITAQLAFVPKNALSFRSIGIEPLLNLMYQLGYGAYMAQRLAAFGVDIRDQSRNQRAACTGSLTGALATLDLSSASDTVSREIVYELLPLDWAHVLSRGRSGTIELPNRRTLAQEKFSSMGNGYTFPLETLIFWSLASSAVEKSKVGEVCVYGDDIVVPTEDSDLVVEVLRYAGFNVNRKKSYTTGPFRESCGKDYFRGSDVRPFYQKEWVSGQSLFVLHNWYVRHGDVVRAKQVMDRIHPALRLFGPDGFGDGHLLGEHQRGRTAAMQADGYAGYFFESFSTKSRKEIRKDLQTGRGDFPAALYSIYVRGDTGSRGSSDFREVDWFSVVKNRLSSHFADDNVSDFVSERFISGGTPVSADRETGLKSWSLPGFDGYKKVRIYTLGA